MSLYGALYSGVSGLAAQSNKIGQISDNISNVNTVGYKATRASFESLVTTAASSASYSPGGVLGGNQQLVSKQGLLQSTDSATDIAVSGDGFFVVNTQNDGQGSVLYTRAGSFTEDSTGNFRNTAGFFLQAWPLDREGRLPGESGNLNTTSSANLTSLKTVNVKNLTGVAAATSTVSLGANLNAGESIYPGASGTLSPDLLHAENIGLKAKDIIIPGGTNKITRGDRFNVTSNGGLSYTYRYGGFTFGRDITDSDPVANAGDGQQSILSSPTTLTASSGAAITRIATPPSAGTTQQILTAQGTLPAISTVTTGTAGDAFVTIHVASTATLVAGDAVEIAGVTGTAGLLDNIPIGQINGKHKILAVTSATTYTIATTTTAAAGGGSDTPAAATSEPLPFSTASGSTTVKIYAPSHGLTTGDLVDLNGNTDVISGIPASDLVGVFSVTVLDANHYTITAATAANTSPSGGGNATTVAALTPQLLTATGTLPAISTVATPASIGNTITITTTAAHGLITGDAVEIAGVLGNGTDVDGIPIGEINGKHKIVVTGANTYTIITTTATDGTAGSDSPGAATSEPLPFSTAASSTTVTVYAPSHGLVNGDYVSLAGNTDIISGIPSADFNGVFPITRVDADHYTITVAAAANTSPNGGGNATDVTGTGHVAHSNTGTTVTITTTAAHGLKTGDAVTIAGVTAAVDGIPASEINGTRIVTVVDDTHYTITTTTTSDGYGVTATVSSPTTTPLPFITTASSNVVTVRQVGHGLKDGDVVTLAGNSGAVGTIPFGDLNGTFIVDVVDADHYKITVASTAGSTVTGGGAGTVQATSRLSTSGNILDASNVTTSFLANTGTSPFSAAALKFTVTTGGITSTFTYTSASPNAQLGQFNNLTNLAAAINNSVGLTARVSGGRLYVGATDANASVTFANGSDVGTATTPVLWGIDWVRELGFKNIPTGTDRFSSLNGLKDLVENSPGLSAKVANALSDASLDINVDDPLGSITFSDRATIPAITLGVNPFTMTANSGVVTVTLPSGSTTSSYANGDLVTLGAPPAAVNGISSANLTGNFYISNVTATSFDVVAKNGDLASPSVTNPAGGVAGISLTPPTNQGSIVAEFGINGVPSLNGGSYTPKTTGAIGPAYDPSSSAKNIAGGDIVAQFSRPVRVYDSLGGGHDLTIGFIKSAANQWRVEVYAADSNDITSDANDDGLIVSGSLTFNGDGSLQSVDPNLTTAVVTWANGAVDSNINFNWGTAGDPFGTVGSTTIGKTDGVSQFNSAYRVNFANQNGAPVGDLTGVSITDEGYIVASYSNGQTQRLFRIPLADFANPNQLAISSGNVFAQSAESGEVNLRQPGSSGVGKISSSSLEQSNVELADQLTDMIVAQRAYQANTKVISTTDQLLSQLNDILR